VDRLTGFWLRTPDSTRRRWAGLWSLVILSLLIATLIIAWRSRGLPPVIPDPNFPGADGLFVFALGVVPLLAVGWLLTNRATANPYGWLWLLLALMVASQHFIQVLASFLLGQDQLAGEIRIAVPGPDGYVTGTGGSFRFLQWLGFLGDYLWATGIFVLGLLLLTFPDGRLPSPRWRWVARALAWGFAGLVALGWMGGGVSGTVPVRRPTGLFVPGSTGDRIFLFVFDGVLVVTLLLGLLAGAFAVFVRFRRSAGVERQQIKWVMFAGLFFVPTIFWDAPGIWDAVVETTATASVPAGVALAVTRYRLYEIDRIFSRTVAYGFVIALLASIYVVGMFLLQALLPGQSDLAVAASTLAVAALFNPVRVRVLAGVERRFNRARYNAEQVVNKFTDRLRNEVDIDLVTADVGAVVGRVLQPNRLSLWIRD
jgi:hypothetical protein